MIRKLINYFKYLDFNKKKLKSKSHSKSIILVEFVDLKSFVFSNSYFSHTLSKIHNSKIYFYYPNFLSILNKIKLLLQYLNPISNLYLYKSFCNYLVIPNKRNKKDYHQIDIKFYKLKNNRDIIDLKYRNIQIGDLIYDEFLAKYNLPTIDLKSNQFKFFFYETFELILFWENYFLKNNVKSIVLSHSVYIMGLIGRLGISKKIEVYVIAPTSHYKLSRKKYVKWNDHFDYPINFNKFSKKLKNKLIVDAKKNMKLRLSGKQDFRYKVARPISPVFTGSNIKIKKNRIKKNILVAAHCFMDAPHVYGKMIFYDFYEWLEFLGKKSDEIKFKNFNWFIKIHPSLYDRNIKIFNNFISRYPNFKLIDKYQTHNNLISKIGIDYVLTVFGSIAHGYSLYNIPVINAGTNPHMGYKFSITAKSKKDYKKILNNLVKETKKIEIKKNKIFEFYAMHHLLDYDFFDDLKMTYDLKSNSIELFVKFIENINENIHNNKIDVYKNFIFSKKRRLIDLSKWK